VVGTPAFAARTAAEIQAGSAAFVDDEEAHVKVIASS
jgi:hypothetical protein